MVVIEMSIARSGTCVGVTKQPPYHRQRFLIHSRMAGKCVPQIMNTKTGKPSLLAKLSPMCINRAHWTMIGHVPEYPRYLVMSRNRFEPSSRFIAKPDHARTALAMAELNAVAAYSRALIIACLCLSPASVRSFHRWGDDGPAWGWSRGADRPAIGCNYRLKGCLIATWRLFARHADSAMISRQSATVPLFWMLSRLGAYVGIA